MPISESGMDFGQDLELGWIFWRTMKVHGRICRLLSTSGMFQKWIVRVSFFFTEIGYSANPINYGERFGSGMTLAAGTGITVPLWSESKAEFDLGYRYQNNSGKYVETATVVDGLTLSIGFIP
ncbi:MAG TPA: hypothetical protein VGM92_08715 [Candidatus Kapabacteria bacterium]